MVHASVKRLMIMFGAEEMFGLQPLIDEILSENRFNDDHCKWKLRVHSSAPLPVWINVVAYANTEHFTLSTQN
jgi:hypothetical protein